MTDDPIHTDVPGQLPLPADNVLHTRFGELSYRDSNHRYYVRRPGDVKAKPIPSVTTILAEMNKPALTYWAANMAAGSIREQLEEWRAAGKAPLTPSVIDEVCDRAARAHTEKKKEAGRTGSLVHEAIERYHADFFSFAPPEEDPQAVRAWQSFLDWLTSSGYDVESTEQMVLDHELRYAGRFDLLLRDEHGRPWIADAKTGRSIYPEHALQNAAYTRAWETLTGETVAGTMVIHCVPGRPLAILERRRADVDQDYLTFCALVRVREQRRSIEAAIKTVEKARQAEEAELLEGEAA